MAMQLGNFVPDLRLGIDFPEELRFGRLIAKYGGDGVLAVLLLWRWAAKNCPTTGRLEQMNADDVLRVATVDAKHSEFLADLVKWEFLGKGEDEVFFLVGWAEDQPYAAKAEERRRAAQEKAGKRWHKGDAKGGDMPQQCSGNAPALQRECSNTNSNAFKSPPSPPSGGESEVPVNEIADLYAEVLPELPKPVLTKRVIRDLEARWNADPERQQLAWWRGFFARVRTMPRLMGEGDEKLCASLGWLVNRGCMDRVLAGQYLTRAAETKLPLRSMSDEEFENMRQRQAAEAEPEEP